MRYVYMVTDDVGSWPVLRGAPEDLAWAGQHPSVEVEFLAALPGIADRLFHDLAEIAFASEVSTIR